MLQRHFLLGLSPETRSPIGIPNLSFDMSAETLKGKFPVTILSVGYGDPCRYSCGRLQSAESQRRPSSFGSKFQTETLPKTCSKIPRIGPAPRRAPHGVGRPDLLRRTSSALAARACTGKARQITVLSPTTRRSILLISFERSTSAALMAAIVCRNVLTFDPNDTIPPSTTAIDPMVAT